MGKFIIATSLSINDSPYEQYVLNKKIYDILLITPDNRYK